MSHRPATTPCLGARVSALADGTLRDDVRDRALAHTLTCPACRDALDVERLTVERLRILPEPVPSPDLVAALLRLGEPGDPVPPRRGSGPGMPRPALVPVRPVSVAFGPSTSVRPGGGTHPDGRRPTGSPDRRRVRRSVVYVAAAGALGMGAVTGGLVTGAVSAAPGPQRLPSAQLVVGTGSSGQPAGFGRGWGTAGPSAGASTASGAASGVLSSGGGLGSAASGFGAPVSFFGATVTAGTPVTAPGPLLRARPGAGWSTRTAMHQATH